MLRRLFLIVALLSTFAGSTPAFASPPATEISPWALAQAPQPSTSSPHVAVIPSWQPPSPAAQCPDAEPRPRLAAHADTVEVPILMYHQLKFLKPTASKIRYGLTVSPTSFQRQMAYLASQGYEAIGPDDLTAYFKDSVALPPRPVMITFDDGWVEDYTVAYPVLRAYCLKGVFFAPTDWVGRSPYTLSWGQIEEMSRAGMEFGSHTMNHHLLPKEPEQEVVKQLTGSRAILESHLGGPVTALAYPGGTLNTIVVTALQETGYTLAFGVARGVKQTEAGLFWLHRQPVRYWDTLATFKAKLTSPAS